MTVEHRLEDHDAVFLHEKIERLADVGRGTVLSREGGVGRDDKIDRAVSPGFELAFLPAVLSAILIETGVRNQV